MERWEIVCRVGAYAATALYYLVATALALLRRKG